jgi:glycosyltransferase involved in cell wall biosynthesis
VRLNCRGSAPEAAAYGASLALWQRRLVEQADAIAVPSAFARERLRELGAPLPWDRVYVLPPPLRALDRTSTAAATMSPPRDGADEPALASYALVVSRLSDEKGVDVAIDACQGAGLSLVIAGDGPARAELEARAARRPGVGGASVRFLGRVDDAELQRLRAVASVALVPSRSAETFGLAAAEAMACGLPVIASRVGALPDLLGEEGLVPAGDVAALAHAIARFTGDRALGERGRERVRRLCAPVVVAASLAALYDRGADARGADA